MMKLKESTPVRTRPPEPLAPVSPPVDELTDEDLEQVAGGLHRTWLARPEPAAVPERAAAVGFRPLA